MADISVVIPSFNRRDAVCTLVTALFAQHEPEQAGEIIVVLDGSTDGSAEALAELTPPAGLRLEVHPQPNRGLSVARNAGWRRAAGEIVLFLDDDVVPGEGLLAAHRRAHRDADAVLGRIIPHVVPGDEPLAAPETEFFAIRHRELSRSGATIGPLDAAGGHMSVKRRRLLEVDGFDEAFATYGSEDTEFTQRLLEAGITIAYAPDAVVTHDYTGTARQWRYRAWHTGRSHVRLTAKHPEMAPLVDLGSIENQLWPYRVARRCGFDWPGLAMGLSMLLLTSAPIGRRLGGYRLSRRLVNVGRSLAYWSGVRSALDSAEGAE